MPKTRRDKASVSAVSGRVDAVYRLLVAGASRADVMQFAAKQDWPVSTRMIDEYISRANATIEAESAVNRSQEFGMALTRLTDLFARCMRVQDYKTALSVLKERHALLSLYLPEAPKTVALLQGMTPADLQQLSTALESHGLTAGDVFAALMSRLAEESHDRP